MFIITAEVNTDDGSALPIFTFFTSDVQCPRTCSVLNKDKRTCERRNGSDRNETCNSTDFPLVNIVLMVLQICYFLFLLNNWLCIQLQINILNSANMKFFTFHSSSIQVPISGEVPLWHQASYLASSIHVPISFEVSLCAFFALFVALSSSHDFWRSTSSRTRIPCEHKYLLLFYKPTFICQCLSNSTEGGYINKANYDGICK